MAYTIKMNILEVNSTEKAKNKIKKIAQNNNLDYEFVYSILSFCWNYDKNKMGLDIGWVKNLDMDNEYSKRLNIVCDKINLKENLLNKDETIEKLYNNLSKVNTEKLKNDFLYGSQHGNKCYISEYSSFYYLNNATKEKLGTLYWNDNKPTIESLMKSIFLKLHNGGMDARNGLQYLCVDLTIKLPYLENETVANDWTNDFIKNIVIEKYTLSDLIKQLKQYCKGDKYFYQIILQAISFSGILKVAKIDVSKLFLPDYRNIKSKHFYSNEWSYPLRFCNE
jgi:hypothetical protein